MGSSTAKLVTFGQERLVPRPLEILNGRIHPRFAYNLAYTLVTLIWFLIALGYREVAHAYPPEPPPGVTEEGPPALDVETARLADLPEYAGLPLDEGGGDAGGCGPLGSGSPAASSGAIDTDSPNSSAAANVSRRLELAGMETPLMVHRARSAIIIRPVSAR